MLNKNFTTKIILTVSSLILLSGCYGKRKAHALGDLPKDFAVAVRDRVHFDFDSSSLTPESKSNLDKQAAWILNHNFGHYVVAGHADERGTREYNLALGERRADSVKKYLVSRGVDPKIVTTVSFGKEKPLALGHDEESWKQNRRAVTSHKLSVSSKSKSASDTKVQSPKRKFKSDIAQKAYEKSIEIEKEAKEKAKKAKAVVKEKVHNAAEIVEQKAEEVKEATTPESNE